MRVKPTQTEALYLKPLLDGMQDRQTANVLKGLLNGEDIHKMIKTYFPATKKMSVVDTIKFLRNRR